MKRDWSKYSKFWMGDTPYEFNPKTIDMSDISTILKLSAYKKAVANFVHIATGKNIPVLYNTGQQSKTDNTVVILSAKLEENRVDPAVGVALHEATHIVKSNFHFLQDLDAIINSAYFGGIYKDYDVEWLLLHNVISAYTELIKNQKLSPKTSSLKTFRTDYIGLIANFIEDKRIDDWQYKNSPGYRGYYTALYEEAFSSVLINKGIRSKNFRRTETWESYKFRIINITNENTDLDALKGLREINDVINLSNISRLKNSIDTFNIAIRILDIVFRYIAIQEKENSTKKSTKKQNLPKQYRPEEEDDDGKEITDDDVKNQDSDTTEDDNLTGDDNYDTASPSVNNESSGENDEDDKNLDNENGENTNDNKQSNDEADDSKNDVNNEDGGEDSEASDLEKEDSKDTLDSENDVDDENDITPNQEKQIEREERKQDNFLNGDTKKESLSKDISDLIKICEDADVSIERVGSNLLDAHGNIRKVDCVVIRKVTYDLVKSAKFLNMFDKNESSGFVQENIKSIASGANLGMRLGRKLQIRNDARVTKYSRLEDGKVDKKLLSSLGHGNTHIFYHTKIDKYNPIILHISVDASGSMQGVKWNKTMITTVAICKAASMVSNLNVVVSFRGMAIKESEYKKSWSGGIYDCCPLIAIAYDSRVDKFVKIQQIFKYIVPQSSTPEGLAFESILDEMVAGNSNKLDSYFLNLSDGEPYFTTIDFNYSGERASKHTNSIVRLIRARGIKIMSYFINDEAYVDAENKDMFKMCYDKDARFINVNNIVELATTLNELFLRKD